MKNIFTLIAIVTFFTSCLMDKANIDVGFPGTETIDGKTVMTFYVSANGNDKNETLGTNNDPLLSVQSALSRITIRWREQSDAPDSVIIKVQQGTYTPGNGLSPMNMGIAVLNEHYSGFYENPRIVIEGGYDKNWNAPDYSQAENDPENSLSVLDGMGLLHHVFYVNRPNVIVKGFLIKGGNAQNQPLGTDTVLNDFLWKYGGGMFVHLYYNQDFDYLFFENNRADYSNEGTGLMLYMATYTTDFRVNAWMGTGQTMHYWGNVNLNNVGVNYYNGGDFETNNKTYYVATDGADSEAFDGDSDQPFISIQYALQRILSDHKRDGLLKDTVFIKVKKGIYTRHSGLRDGNIGFYVNDSIKYPSTEKPFIVLEGAYDENWQRPDYSIQFPDPVNNLSVLNGEGSMQHIAVISRNKFIMKGFLLENGLANNSPNGNVEVIDPILSNHLWQTGAGMLVNLKNNNLFQAIYFENNSTTTGRATGLALLKVTDPNINDFSGWFYLGSGQTASYTQNFDLNKFNFVYY